MFKDKQAEKYGFIFPASTPKQMCFKALVKSCNLKYNQEANITPECLIYKHNLIYGNYYHHSVMSCHASCFSGPL